MEHTILITGGAGFIGSNFTLYYFRKHPEAHIVVFDKLTYAGNLNNLRDILNDPRFTFVHGDIVDKQFVFGLFKKGKFDVVVNFAAETHVDSSIELPEIFMEVNAMGTNHLLMACKEYGMIRFHQISTDEVYGDLGDSTDTYFNEETPYAPSSPYSASKAAADLLCRAFFRTYNLPVTISNCSNNYGPYQFPEKLIPYFYKLVKQGQKLPVYGDGKNVRDWLYVEDHCNAIDLILHKGRLGETYCVGGNSEKQNLEVIQAILKYANVREDQITFVEDRKGHDRRYAINFSKIRNELGWTPTVTFDEGIQLTLQWYEKNKNWWQNLKAQHNRF